MQVAVLVFIQSVLKQLFIAEEVPAGRLIAVDIFTGHRLIVRRHRLNRNLHH